MKVDKDQMQDVFCDAINAIDSSPTKQKDQ